jgi:hypothetical protein
MVGALLVAAFTHVGQTYDPSTRAWFTDHTKDAELARWDDNAFLIGLFVSGALAAVYYFSAGRGPREDQRRAAPAESRPRLETWFGHDGRPMIRGSRSSLDDHDGEDQRPQD